VVVQSRANYARIKSVLVACAGHPDLDLQVILGASAVLERYGDLRASLQAEGLNVSNIIHNVVEGAVPATMVKSTALGMIELSSAFENLRPDIVLTVADRFETLATAVAASYMNISVAHTQGGEFTGSIDESVRHSITKLSQIHFPATERARNVLIRMGEAPRSVFLTGCPSIDLAAGAKSKPSLAALNRRGVGGSLDPAQPYLVVVQHPVTTEFDSAQDQAACLIESVERLRNGGLQVVWMWPNIDAGSDAMSKALRTYREDIAPENVHFYKNFDPEEFLSIMQGCTVMIGNSSAAIREGSFLGVPAVNVGSRQAGRERGPNVIDVGYDADVIYSATQTHLNREQPIESSTLYGDGNAGQRIAQHLAEVDLTVQKSFYIDGEK